MSSMKKPDLEVDDLRRRNVPLRKESHVDARRAVLQLNALEEKTADVTARKTFGRTPDGTVFTVPVTHDMVSQLLSPAEPKNVSDALVILVLVLHFLAFRILPQPWRIPLLGAIFLIWRAGYNIGIGWLLHKQSHQLTLVRWARKSRLFDKPEDTSHPRLRSFIKSELETKIPKDYNFDAAPLEYNTWLVFRRIVDLILMCDFTSYVLFAIACGHKPVGESLVITMARWVIGISLFIFNLWVKLDAHRVVKDYAWYWGDFFYLIDQELTFDGVFEMAPHPMYSIGYVGYYGISLMAASYKVLFVSIIAHAAQFAFLVWVENPHIERTYNSPPPRRQINDLPKAATDRPAMVRSGTAEHWPNPSSDKPSATHDLLGIQNLDLYRTTDSSLIVLVFSFICLTLSSPDTPTFQALFIINAIVWRVWFSVGIGYLLNRQSLKKKWTRHFLKFGDSIGEAWRQWKGTYHMSMVLCYVSFAAAAWKVYEAPANWEVGLALFEHVIGFSLIILQLWVSFSIYDSLGEFGWFFGDFFFDQSPKLTYGGIYRFLNNPERVLGLAGVWGVALITSSKAIFALALLSHTLSLAFIQFVERPHMQKLYGRSLRQDAGLVRSLRRSLPPPLRQWQDSMDKFLDETFDRLEDILDAAKPKLAAGVITLVQDTREILRKYPTRIPITRGDSDLTELQMSDYSIEIGGEGSASMRDHVMGTGDEQPSAAQKSGPKTLCFEYGAPIKVKWSAPNNHSRKDWIGLYKVADNNSRDITHIATGGRWIATNRGEYDTESAEVGIIVSDVGVAKKAEEGEVREFSTGEMMFSGDKLWWIQGSFEFRYHHNGKHHVMAISQPFEVRIPRFNEDEVDASLSAAEAHYAFGAHDSLIRRSIEQTLLPIVQNCFDRDPDIAPHDAHETFGSLVERDGKFARRVVYAIQHMFGIEFAPQVVKADGKVQNLAWRIWEAKKVLAPYSMSRSRGDNTPVEGDSKND